MLSPISRMLRAATGSELPAMPGVPISPIRISPWAGAVLLFAAIVFLSFSGLLWMQVTLDHDILVAQNAFRESSGLVPFFQIASRWGLGLMGLLILVEHLASVSRRMRHSGETIVLVVLLSLGISYLVADVSKRVIDRERPFVTYADEVSAVETPQSPSYPSTATAMAFAIAIPFVLFAPPASWWTAMVKMLVALLALLVASARVALGAHYLSDVLAGAGVAIAMTPVAVLLANVTITGLRITENRLPPLNWILAIALAAVVGVLLLW